jgi:hypothetical protein
MKTKRLVIMATLPLLACAAATAALPLFLFLRGDDRFSTSQFQRLKEGMTRDEVSALLGAPGDYTNGAGTYRLYSSEGVIIEELSAKAPAVRLERCWCGPAGAIEVYFDDDGRLSNKWHYVHWPPPPTAWEEITDWFAFNKP